jgi:CheY-like chemotaxis protein
VLVVEDDPDIAEVLTMLLPSLGYEAISARNGAEALRLLERVATPCLILLDLMMPVMNGWQFLEEVARIASLKDIPVVVVTAAAPTEVPGAVEVVHKPMDLGLLIEIVERHAHGAG